MVLGAKSAIKNNSEIFHGWSGVWSDNFSMVSRHPISYFKNAMQHQYVDIFIDKWMTKNLNSGNWSYICILYCPTWTVASQCTLMCARRDGKFNSTRNFDPISI